MRSEDSIGASLLVPVVKTALPLLGVQVPALVGKQTLHATWCGQKRGEQKKKDSELPTLLGTEYVMSLFPIRALSSFKQFLKCMCQKGQQSLHFILFRYTLLFIY